MRVLIVEDNRGVQNGYRALLEDRLEVVSALTRKEALDAFKANPDFAAIVMDACLEGNKPDTFGLISIFRRTFKGPMIAASSEDKYCDQLVEAGCDHKSTKENLPHKLYEILGLIK